MYRHFTTASFGTRLVVLFMGLALALAVGISIPLGVLAAKVAWLEAPVLGVVSVAYTIPSLALLVFMLPLLGIGAAAAQHHWRPRASLPGLPE